MMKLPLALAAALAMSLAPASASLAQTAVQASAQTQAPARTATIQRAGVQPRATPVERRVYENAATQMSRGDTGPRYSCEHDSAGNPTSCWCNWDSDANDCKDMILNEPCGADGAWWTSDVDGEYGCDRQSGG